MRVGIDCRKIADFGIGTYIRGLLQGLAELGGDQYVAFGPQAIAGMLPGGVEHVIVDAPKYSVRELFTIGRAADQARLDVFHAPHYIVPFTHVPVVVTIHDLIHLRHRNPLARSYARAMIGRAVRRSRHVIAVSEEVRSEIAAHFGHAEKIAVTPEGVDAAFLSGAPAPPPAPPPARYFLFVGNDKPHKNVDRLVEALNRVPDVQLLLVGGTFERFRNRTRVVVTGFVPIERLAAFYRGAIALVIPSLEEGFGLPALEAMACGTAVITSNAAALVELTGDAALHVDGRSIDSIAAAMTRVRNDEALRASMIERGRMRANAFTWRRCAEMTRDVYRGAHFVF